MWSAMPLNMGVGCRFVFFAMKLVPLETGMFLLFFHETAYQKLPTQLQNSRQHMQFSGNMLEILQAHETS